MFRLRDWKVERTPINTPDTDNIVPGLQVKKKIIFNKSTNRPQHQFITYN